MPDILNSISYDKSMKAVIKVKNQDPDFSYKDWSKPDLEPVRKIIRDFYRKEQNGKCAYCKNPVSLQSANNCHVEHIAPKSKYQKFIFEAKNLCVICADCNEIKREQETLSSELDPIRKKSVKLYPRSKSAFLIVHPHFDNYNEHIKILSGNHYIDLSMKGHFTIGSCKLNRFLHRYGWPDEISTLDDILSSMNKIMDTPDPIQQIMEIKKLGAKINSNQQLF